MHCSSMVATRDACIHLATGLWHISGSVPAIVPAAAFSQHWPTSIANPTVELVHVSAVLSSPQLMGLNRIGRAQSLVGKTRR